MTTPEKNKLIGTVRYLNVDGLRFPVTVIDVSESFGRVDLKVSPVGGKGERNVSMDRTVETLN